MSSTENNDEISLKELILKIKEWCGYLFSKWLLILMFGVIGAGIGLYYAINQKPKYTGTLTFVLSSDSKSGGGLASLAGQFGIDMGGMGASGAFEGENIIELLKSRKIVTDALFQKIPDNNLILINLIAEKAEFFKGWSKNKRVASLIPFPDSINRLTPVQDSLISVIHGFLIKEYVKIAKPDKKLSFYSVGTTSPDEMISVYLTKYLVESASAMYIETKTKTAKQSLVMLQKEADSLRARLSGTMYSAAATVDQTFNLNPALQSQRVPIQQNQVQAQVLGAAYSEVVKNLEVAKITLQKETPLYQVIDEPRFPLVRTKFGKSKGILIGGIIAGFVCILWLLGRKIYKGVMEE